MSATPDFSVLLTLRRLLSRAKAFQICSLVCQFLLLLFIIGIINQDPLGSPLFFSQTHPLPLCLSLFALQVFYANGLLMTLQEFVFLFLVIHNS